jgi:hypothetical protein
MQIDKNTTLSDFLFKTDVFKIPESKLTELFGKLEKRKPPSIAGKKTPDDLNDLLFGQLAKLQTIKNISDFLLSPAEIIIGLKRNRLMDCLAFDVIGFMLFVRNEIVRIGKLFDAIRYRPGSEELQAGIDKIDGGLFGVMDWYARRMGMKTHEEAENTKWIFIYNCLKIDSDNARYQKKLNEIYSKRK